MKLSKLFQLTIFLRFSAAAGSSSPSESRQADDGPGDMGVGGAVLASSALFSSLRVADLRRVILIVSDVFCGNYKLKYIKISPLSEKLFHVRRVSTRTASREGDFFFLNIFSSTRIRSSLFFKHEN